MNNNIKRRFYSSILAIFMSISLSSCGTSKENCEVDEEHAHIYVTESGLKKPCISEQTCIQYDFNGFSFSRLYKTEEYILLSLNDTREIMNIPERLFRICDNLDYITNIEEQLQDYYEYEYEYAYTRSIPTSKGVIYSPLTVRAWTDDPTHFGLTGKVRLCHHLYRGYKIIDKDGEIQVIESPEVNSYKDLDPEYQYIYDNYGEEISYDYENIEDKSILCRIK